MNLLTTVTGYSEVLLERHTARCYYLLHPMRRWLNLALMAGTLLPAPAFAGTVRVCVQDGSGVSIEDVLVIIQPMYSERFGHDRRALTAKDGCIAFPSVSPSFYRIYAMQPYGIFETTIQEMAAADAPIDLKLTLQASPSHGYGDIILVGTKHADVAIVRADGSPAAGADVMVRDAEDTLASERNYTADENGKINVELTGGDPTAAVVMIGKQLFTTELTSSGPKTIKLPF
jgi:hypothetical protein